MNTRFKFYIFVATVLIIWFSPQRWVIIPPKINLEDYAFTKMEKFDLDARVLSKKAYTLGRSAELAPVDLALGWGRMAEQKYIENLDIKQSKRWYRWKYKDVPIIPMQEVSTHSANMHMIPANDEALRSLIKVRKGDMIELRGHLVYVSASDGFRWQSSLTRNDTGDGACEVVLVDSINIVKE